MTFDPDSELGPGMGGPTENLKLGLNTLADSIAEEENVVGNQRVLSDGSLYVERENEHVEFRNRHVDGGNTHVTVPKGDSNRGPHKTSQSMTNETYREDLDLSDI